VITMSTLRIIVCDMDMNQQGLGKKVVDVELGWRAQRSGSALLVMYIRPQDSRYETMQGLMPWNLLFTQISCRQHQMLYIGILLYPE